MAANQPSNASTSKVTAPPAPQLTSTSSQGSNSAGDSHPQRRSGGSGSFGAGATARSSHATGARNKQAARNQHKQSRRWRLTDEDAIAESAAMNSTRNRRGQTSITHLMSFSLPPRPSHFQQHQNTNSRHLRRNPTFGIGSGHHAVDKARYVHANYRFIVDPRHDYHAQSVDADVYLEWANILQILASPQSQAAACPICLGDPVAPRMAKCGHMFCLHCLIRYMHSTDDDDHHLEKRPRWKKCPICWDAMYISETRPVRWYIGQEGPSPRDNEDIVLRLVMRPAGSTLALPRDVQPLSADQDIPWHFAANVMDYARFMKGSESYMIEQFDQEIQQIEEVEKHDELMFGEDTEWTSRAIRAIRDAKERVKGLGDPPSPLLKPEEQKPQKKPPPPMELHQDTPEMYVLQQAAKSGQSIPNNPPLHETDPTETPTTPSSTTAEPKDPIDHAASSKSALSASLAEFRAQQHSSHHPHADYYFYQALLHYYLSPLDIRILKVAFGDFSLFPSTILPRVERVSTGHVVDDDLRKRAKYLSHLPYGCEVGFLECDWTDTVPAEVLEKFKPDIERRRKKNLDKETREEKERVRAEKVEEDKRYAAARRRRPNSPSSLQLQPDDFQPLAAAAAAAITPTAGQDSDIAQSLDSGGAESTSPLWQSRAQNGSAFASLASPSTSPSTSRTVWGTSVITPASPTLAPIPREAPAMDDGWLKGWERDLLSEEDLVTQVEAASLADGDPPKPSGASSTRKKKGKKITLMSTSSARRGA